MTAVNRYDKEETIIKDFQFFKFNQVRFFPININNFMLYRSIHNKKKWKQWVNSSAKHELPPDFYNNKKKLMMEVMRIDDHSFEDKNGKIRNLHNEKESKFIKSLINENSEIINVYNSGNLFINTTREIIGRKDHNYDLYKKNFKRVVEKHLNKLNLYKKNHPGFKTVFFIVDESTPYMKLTDTKPPTKVGELMIGDLHYWWLDYNLLKIIKNSQIDYVIWMTPYKYFFTIPKKKCPKIIIYDVSKINLNMAIKYNKELESVEM